MAQLDPPSLRCLQVLTNGDVKLSWLPPPDPGITFYSYEIFWSTSSSGPFTALSPTISSINTVSYLHTGTPALSSGIYYYMVTHSGPGGATHSIHSDTLRTLFFNVFNNTSPVAIELKYNNLHEPKLPSSLSTFTIEKEYPIGTWNALAIYPGLSYFDTLSVCSASINYRTSLMDGSGCISVSNIIGGNFKDTKFPERPIIDSISVLPNGNTVLAWRVPIDKDIVKYEIQYKSAATYTPVDVVNGRSSLTYTFLNTKANSDTILLGVAAIDSCNKGSTVNYTLNSMFLKTEYDSCAYITKLRWNEYLSMPKGILNYRVLYSLDGVTFKEIGRTKSTNFEHQQVDGGRAVHYFIRVANTDLSITASSNRVGFFTSQTPIPDYIYIKDVSAASKSSNRLNILVDTSKESRGIDIQRSEDSLHFETIGFVPYAGSPNLVFVDQTAAASSKSYYYKLALRDACGNLRSVSNVVKTILLKVKQDPNDLFLHHLSWTKYSGFAAFVKEYRVVRIVNNVPEPTAIATTQIHTNSYSDNLEDLAAKGTKIEYIVQAVENGGNPYGVVGTSDSNPVDVYIEGRLWVPNTLMPNGINKTWQPVMHFVDESDYHIKVFNRWGNVVFETRLNSEAWDGANCQAGVYVYIIHYKNARGEHKEITGTINLIL